MRHFALIVALIVPTAAYAQDDDAICADRPGLGTPPCVISKGQVVAELGLASWTLNRSAGEREDSFVLGDSLTRIGVGGETEVQVGWTAFGFVREREGGVVSHGNGTGDVSVAVRHAIATGDSLQAAVMGRVVAPVGGEAIGQGEWSFDFLAPVSVPLATGWSLDLTPMVSAAADEDRHGHHLAYGGVVGVTVPLVEGLSSEVEVAASRDDDPMDATTPVQLGLSFSYTPNKDLQLDCGANLGLDDDADDVQLYVGIARRF